MAQVTKLRKPRVFVAAVVVALVLGGGEAAPVWSLALPLETPTVPVQAPAPPVKTPTVPVKAPTVPIPPVKVPTVPVPPVKAPTVPVKVPTVPVKVPTVPLKTPTVKTTTSPVKSVKAPPVSIKTPPVSVKGPSADINTRAGSVHTTAGSVSVNSVSVNGSTDRNAGSGASSGSSRGATTAPPTTGSAGAGAGSGAGTSDGSPAPPSPTPLGTYSSPGAGYAELPPIEGTPGKRARARIARRERLLKAAVERFQGCLVALPASNRQVLELRSGYGDARPLSPRATAALLHVGAPQLARVEKQAMRELSDAAATHSCVSTGEVVEAAMSFIGAGFGGGQAGTTGRMEVASFKTSQPLLPTPGPTLVGRVLGTDVPPVASDLIVVLLLVMLLGGTVVLVVADAAGQGPRHEQWRRRVINRLRALR
jgi:hypothetical protein